MIAGHSLDTWSRAFPRRFRSAAPPRAPRAARPALPPAAKDVGIVERRNPLPVSRYWVDVFEKDAEKFAGWLLSNRDRLKVRATEHFSSDPPRDWFLFEVLSPVMWDGPGYPDVATENIKSSADTVQRPPPEKDASDALGDAIKGGAVPVAWVLGGAAVVALLLVLSR